MWGATYDRTVCPTHFYQRLSLSRCEGEIELYGLPRMIKLCGVPRVIELRGVPRVINLCAPHNQIIRGMTHRYVT